MEENWRQTTAEAVKKREMKLAQTYAYELKTASPSTHYSIDAARQRRKRTIQEHLDDTAGRRWKKSWMETSACGLCSTGNDKT